MRFASLCSGSLIGEASGCQPEDCGFKSRPLLQRPLRTGGKGARSVGECAQSSLKEKILVVQVSENLKE